MSRRVDAHWRELAGKLPKQPCDDLQEEVMMAVYDEDALGTGLLLYHRESIELSDPIAQTMDEEAWDKWERSRKRRWGARCTCSACGEDFIAGYESDGKDSGIVLLEGEDGMNYKGYAEKGEPEAIVYYEGETIICPHCWQSVEVTRRSKLKHGRTHQVMQAETLNVEGYLTVMYWLVSRYQDDTGLDTTHFLPHAALIVDKMGRLRRFRAVRHSAEVQGVTWTPCERSCDPMQQPYYCYGAINGRQVGGWVCEYGPESGGTTGEKTALEEYIGKGGHWPGAYLHVWQKHPQVENLMRGGFSAAVTESIDYELDTCGNRYLLQDAPNIAWVDWSETKSNRMLGMSKEAYRALRGERWGRETAALWGKYRREVKNADALQFVQEVRKIGAQSMERLLGIRNVEPDMTPSRTVRYLEKQKCSKAACSCCSTTGACCGRCGSPTRRRCCGRAIYRRRTTASWSGTRRRTDWKAIRRSSRRSISGSRRSSGRTENSASACRRKSRSSSTKGRRCGTASAPTARSTAAASRSSSCGTTAGRSAAITR